MNPNEIDSPVVTASHRASRRVIAGGVAALAASAAAAAIGLAFHGRTGAGAGAVEIGITDGTANAAGDAQQTIVIKGTGNAARLRVAYSTDGAMLLEQDVALGHGIVLTCAFSNPGEFLPATMQVGTSWTFDSSCPATAGQSSLTMHVVNNYTVTGTTQVTLGGHSGPAFIVHNSSTTTITGAATVTTTVDETQDFVPGLGIAVNTVTKTHSDAGGKITDSNSTLTLNGLTVG